MGRKVTGSLRSELEEFWGRFTTKKFFHKKGIISSAHFDSVYWLGYKWTISKHLKTFLTFITKKVSGWCGCNSKLLLWEENIINKCPQCVCNHETSKHLIVCTDPGCVLQLHNSIEAIMDFLNEAKVTSELSDIIETYLLLQGHWTMEDCVKPNSKYVRLSADIDNLGWDCFVEGQLPYSLITVIKLMFCWYKPCGSIKIWGTKFIKSLIGLTHKQWLYRNCDVHYISNGLTLRQHDKLTSKIKVLTKTNCTALLGQHRQYMDTNFNTLGCRLTIACLVWVANMEMAISIAKVAKGNFCTQKTLRQLRTPLTLPMIQHTPIRTPINVCNTSLNPPPIYHAPAITLRACAYHASSSKTPYSKPRTNHQPLLVKPTPPPYLVPHLP